MSATVPAAQGVTSRLILRDGSTAGVRPATASDHEAMRRFFDELSPKSRRLRFLALSAASEDLITRLCDSTDPDQALTLIVCRRRHDEMQIVGVGSYFLTTPRSAEVAFAIDDNFHGKGIATALLEQLVRAGRDRDFAEFSASVLPENFEMLDVFRDSGFEVTSTTDAGCVEVLLSLRPSSASAAAADERDRHATIASLKAILRPGAVAVVGVSRWPSNLGRRVFESLLASGFKGDVHAVNPSGVELHGRRCYVAAGSAGWRRSRGHGGPARAGPVGCRRLRRGRRQGARRDHGGLRRNRSARPPVAARTGREGPRLRHAYGRPQLHGRPQRRAACGLNASFAPTLPPPGRIALASQSGGLGLAILKLAARTPARALDVRQPRQQSRRVRQRPAAVLPRAIPPRGRSSCISNRSAIRGDSRNWRGASARSKPIVVVKAGRTRAGRARPASHTAGLASSDVAVDALFRQSGVIRADTIDEMFDIAMCLDPQPLPPAGRGHYDQRRRPGILAADACTTAGLEVHPSAGGLTNPCDLIASAEGGAFCETIEAMMSSDDVDAVIAIYTTIDSSRTSEILTAIAAGVVAGRARGATNKPVLVCTMASPRRRPCAPETKPCRCMSSQSRRRARSERRPFAPSGGRRRPASSCRSTTCGYARRASSAGRSRSRAAIPG